ncbi:DNA-processing protein DprA [Candidatus Parcubacteria bacterium]|nr:DNA-processing protein DprA [Candidatus Parcubacteria bacterium]
MNSIRTIRPDEYPALLKEALKDAKDAPARLFIRGDLPSDDHIFLTVVGSRRHTDYGRAACEMLVKSLRGLPVVVISGLAHGIDSIAHEAALKYGIRTIAVPGSGLADDMIYPAAHIGLARRILDAGGALLSPFEETVMGNNWTFPYRNRIMAGMSKATLVVEADLRSGTLITSGYALRFNRDVFVVPGSIFSKQSAGPNDLWREGATPITSGDELVQALGFAAMTKGPEADHADLSPDEKKAVGFLADPMSRQALIEKIGMDASEANALISSLEIKGLIEEKLGLFRLV